MSCPFLMRGIFAVVVVVVVFIVLPCLLSNPCGRTLSVSKESDFERAEEKASRDDSASPSQPQWCTETRHYDDHPVLCDLLQWDADIFAARAHTWARQQGHLVQLRHTREQTRPPLVVSKTPAGTSNPLDFTHANGNATVSRSITATSSATTTTETSSSSSTTTTKKSALPIVLAHGMGDSCFNHGMQALVEFVRNQTQAPYVTCIALGDTQAEDTRNGYFLNMDASVDLFRDKIAQDVNLQKYTSFHAMGLSQGNNIIRGYIARFNEPPVHTFISVNGVNAGESAVPYCRPEESTRTDSNVASADKDAVSELQRQLRHPANRQASSTPSSSMCDLLMEQASRSAYTTFAQEHSFQANYWRDPRPGHPYEKYLEYSQLARWNNEVQDQNATFRDNWSKTQQFVWILATQDGMVWPREGEHWGAPDPSDPFVTILPREETRWFQEDLFGLRTAELAGKNHYESFEGDHLQFSVEDMNRWLSTYITV